MRYSFHLLNQKTHPSGIPKKKRSTGTFEQHPNSAALWQVLMSYNCRTAVRKKDNNVFTQRHCQYFKWFAFPLYLNWQIQAYQMHFNKYACGNRQNSNVGEIKYCCSSKNGNGTHRHRVAYSSVHYYYLNLNVYNSWNCPVTHNRNDLFQKHKSHILCLTHSQFSSRHMVRYIYANCTYFSMTIRRLSPCKGIMIEELWCAEIISKQFNCGWSVVWNSCGTLPSKINEVCLKFFKTLQPEQTVLQSCASVMKLSPLSSSSCTHLLVIWN